MDNSPAAACQIDEIVAFVERRQMHQIALFLLEMLRPFSGSLAIVSEGFAPLFSFLFGKTFPRSMQQLLADRESLALLIARIEESAEQAVLSREEYGGR